MTGYEGLECRPVEDGDEPFLRRLFLETKEDLAASLSGNPLAEGILDMQFRAKQSFYQSAFPGADCRLLLLAGVPIGRLTTFNDGKSLHVVDIALLSAYRGRGIGSASLEKVWAEATAAGLPTILCVELENPARKLYERLGFREIGRTETDVSMRREP